VLEEASTGGEIRELLETLSLLLKRLKRAKFKSMKKTRYNLKIVLDNRVFQQTLVH
jgi:hypothetical protein